MFSQTEITLNMSLEKIHAFFNLNDTTSVLRTFLLLISVYAFFTLLQGVPKWYKLRQKRPPGPVGLPFVGYLPFLGKAPYKTIYNLRKKYGPVISIYLGRKYTIIINEYKVMKEVLGHPGSLNRSAEIFKHIAPGGFGSKSGGRWFEQRRFSMTAAKDLGLGKDKWGALIMEELFCLIKKLQEQKGKPYEISDDLLVSISAGILSLLIGRRLSEDEVDKVHLSIDLADAAIAKMGPSNPISLVPGLRELLEILKIGGYDKAKNTIRQFQSFIQEEIQKHKTSPLLRDIPDFINAYLGKIAELSKANDKKHGFTDIMLQGNLIDLFLGASDTVYSSLRFLFRILCKHKDIQERMYKELIEVLGKDGQARYEDRDTFPYTFAVLMEVLRYASIVPLSTTRKASQDIPVNGYIIEKGSEIITNLWGLHHDPEYWDEPEEFRPERFLIEGGTKINKHPISFAPFSFGRRNCPGETIAWMELLYYSSEILRRFEVSTPPGVEPEFEVMNGLVIRLTNQPLCFKERKN